MNYFLAVYTLSLREIVRFFRQPSRVVGAAGTAFLFWGVLGAGLGTLNGTDFRVYFFPGILVMSVMFACIFATSSVIEDRREGFLQSVLVAPVPRSVVVMGKILGGALVASFQGLILLVFAGTVDAAFRPLPLAQVALCLFLTAFTLTALGFWLAWRMESIPGFHTLMNLLLLPLWMASGAVFPAASSPGLKWLMTLDPLTYGVAGVRHGLYPDAAPPDLPSFGVCLAVLAGSAVLFYALSSWVVARTGERK